MKPISLLSLLLICGTALVAGLVATDTADAYPKPSIIQKSWQLDFTYDKPRAIEVEDVDGKKRWYWYIKYKAVNNTGRDRLFIPSFTIATNRGEIMTAGENVPATVFEAIKKKSGNTLLESPNQVVGRFLQGEDYAKESVAIWPADTRVEGFSVFVEGLSGESQIVKNPLTGKDILLSKSLWITFETPGNPRTPDLIDVQGGDSKWVMR